MKAIKSALLLGMCAVVLLAFTACGEPYSGVKFDDYIKLGKYKGLSVNSYSTKVTDKEVNDSIKQRREAAASNVDSKTGTVKKGDTINIDYVGKIGGKEFKNGSAKGQFLNIGSNQFIDGFETGLIGVKVGDTKTLHLTFPKDYNDTKVAGKKVTFDVTVNSKQVRKVPDLDEDFVKDQMKKAKNEKVRTVAEYKEYVKKELKKEKKKQGIEEQKSYIWNQLVSSTTVKKDKKGKEKYPEKEVERVSEQITSQYEDYAKQNKLKLKDFLKQQMNMDEKTFKKQVKSYAQSMVKEEMIVYAVAEKEDISVSNDEYDKFIEDQLSQYGYTEEQYEEQTGKSYEDANGKDNIKTQVCKNKVQDFMLKHAKVKKSKN